MYIVILLLAARAAFGNWDTDDKTALAASQPSNPYSIVEDGKSDDLVDYGGLEDRAFRMAEMLTTEPYVYDPRFFQAADALLKLGYSRTSRHILLFFLEAEQKIIRNLSVNTTHFSEFMGTMIDTVFGMEYYGFKEKSALLLTKYPWYSHPLSLKLAYGLAKRNGRTMRYSNSVTNVINTFLRNYVSFRSDELYFQLIDAMMEHHGADRGFGFGSLVEALEKSDQNDPRVVERIVRIIESGNIRSLYRKRIFKHPHWRNRFPFWRRIVLSCRSNVREFFTE